MVAAEMVGALVAELVGGLVELRDLARATVLGGELHVKRGREK